MKGLWKWLTGAPPAERIVLVVLLVALAFGAAPSGVLPALADALAGLRAAALGPSE